MPTEDLGPPTRSGIDPLAVASLVCALVWLAGLGSVAGVILGLRARHRIDRDGGKGEGLAFAGIFLGVLGFFAGIAWLALYAPGGHWV
jgi:hypothetical protein